MLTGIFAILALSLDVIYGQAGQFSFGHQSFFGIGAYASALVTVKLGVSVWVGFLSAVLAAGLLGLLIAYITLRSLRGVYLAVVTFGFGLILYSVAVQWYPVTGGVVGLLDIPAPELVIPYLFRMRFQSEVSYYYLVLAILLGVVALLARLPRSRFGRDLMSLRENEALAASVGINPLRLYVTAFTLATGMAGLAGALYGHHLRVVNPGLLGTYYMFVMLVMVVAGGSGPIGGPILGSALFLMIPALIPVAVEYRLIALGVVLLLCTLLAPRGLYPILLEAGSRFIRPLPKGTP